MRPFPVAVAALVFISAGSASLQAQVVLDTNRTIIVSSGVARQNAVPDRATVTLLVEPQGMSVEEAGNRLASVERAVLDTLRRLNIPASSIQTVNSGVGPYRSNMGPNLGGPSFSGRSIIRVESIRLDQVAAVTGAGLAKGATTVLAPSYTLSTSDSLRRTLVPRAFTTAREEAEALATAAGGRLGKLLEVSVSQAPNFNEINATQIMMSNIMYGDGNRSVPSTPVSLTVTTRWLLVR